MPVSDAVEVEEKTAFKSEPERFAWQVLQRARSAMSAIGSQPVMQIYVGMALQVMWIATILAACYFLSSGSLVVWWCDVRACPWSTHD